MLDFKVELETLTYPEDGEVTIVEPEVESVDKNAPSISTLPVSLLNISFVLSPSKDTFHVCPTAESVLIIVVPLLLVSLVIINVPKFLARYTVEVYYHNILNHLNNQFYP